MKPHYILEDLREIRQANKLTQQFVSARAGYSRVELSQYENGARPPRLDAVSNWAEVLGYELVLRPKAVT